jgi:fatty acid synthase
MVNDRRWKLDHPEIPPRGGKILNVGRFDAGFFGVHQRQTKIMDATMRILLETGVEAIMDDPNHDFLVPLCL